MIGRYSKISLFYYYVIRRCGVSKGKKNYLVYTTCELVTSDKYSELLETFGPALWRLTQVVFGAFLVQLFEVSVVLEPQSVLGAHFHDGPVFVHFHGRCLSRSNRFCYFFCRRGSLPSVGVTTVLLLLRSTAFEE